MSNNLSRRTLVTSAAALPTLAVPAGAAIAADDTLARIEEHRACQSKIGPILMRTAELEKTLPHDRRCAYSIGDRGMDFGADDDPRWTAN